MRLGRQHSAPAPADNLVAAGAPVSDEEIVAALQAKMRGLEAEGRDLLAEELKIDKPVMSVRPVPPGSTAVDPRRLALQLMNGFAPNSSAGLSAGERLYEVQIRRQAIKIAVDLCQRDAVLRSAKIMARMIDERGEEWRALLIRTANALLELRRANRARREFRATFVASGVDAHVGLAHDWNIGILGDPVVGDEAYEFLNQLVAAGIISQKEIDNA